MLAFLESVGGLGFAILGAALTAGLAAALFVWLRTRGGRHFAALH